VSDVVATILLLALTVTLFASIFAFVTTFPAPPPQNNNQFQATLNYTAGGTLVAGVQIVHLAGPSVPGTAQVYLKSATQPSAPEFSSPLDPYSVSSGLGGATTWNLGQVWKLTFAAGDQPTSLGNITVYVVSSSQLIFSVILPGAAIAVPPTVVSTWISPANPTIGQAFTVNATLSGSYTSRSVYVNLGSVPRASSPAEVKMTQNGQGVWGFVVKAGNTTTNGTFYAFVNATSSLGQTATGAVIITIASSGGGSSNGPLSVAAVLIPSPANAGVSESVQAVVTYTGSASGAGLSVSFAGTPSPSGPTPYSASGPSGLTISGPASETVLSQTPWVIPNPASITLYTYTLTATATVAGVGTVTGTLTFTPATIINSVSSGLVGSTLTVTGAGFSTLAGSSVALSVGGVSATISGCTSGTLSSNAVTPAAGGGFACTISVPNGAPAGATVVLANDSFTGQADTAVYTVTSWSVVLTPSPWLVGATVTARGAGFAGTSSLKLTMDSVSITPSGSTNATCTFAGSTITTTAAGAFTCQFLIPFAAGAGPATLYANDTSYPAQAATASGTVTAWTLVVGPATGLMGSTATARGAGFQGTSTVTLKFDGVTITPSGSTNGTCTFAGSTITTTAAGTFVCQFVIRNATAGVTAGASTIVATDSSGQVATASTTVTAWTLTVSPTTGSHSSTNALTLTGAGFQGSSLLTITLNGTLLVSGTLSFTCSSGTLSGSTITVTAGGAFTCTLTLNKAAGAAIYTFLASDYTTGQTAWALFSRT